MTNKKDEALKVAREALEKTIDVFRDTEGSYGQIENDALDSAYKAITAIREALAEHPAQQEQKPWVGLTDEEVKHQWEVWRANAPRYMGFATGIEAKLKEKNT